MVGIYIGSTAGYSGKNLVAVALGLRLQKDGLKVGYMKPVGAVPHREGDKVGDEDAFFMLDVLGLDADPALVTPVLVTRDFKVKAFTEGVGDLMGEIKSAYEKLSEGMDVMIVAGSGAYMDSGAYCGVEGVRVARELGLKTLLIDRFFGELRYDSLLRSRKRLGDDLAGVVFNDVPEGYRAEVDELIVPFLERQGLDVFGVIPSDPVMGAIKVSDLAARLSGKVVSAHGRADRVVENFLIGTMQVENFMTHFRRHKNSAIIVGGDRADVQLVALEGACPCLILTGNLYPNDIIMTRSEVLETPIIMVRDDTYTVAKKMEAILSSHKLRDTIKVTHGTQLVGSSLDFPRLRAKLGI
ncbi:phosphotransacetylase family protein [Paucidesulfovibrio longus]|uniref:phosphotransacetylase family protein n=1 Tax=Paucidesulfovibrio longus TaxID=889 RepID=UPI0003B79216|nr:phosphotransacetylase family protein [Paucidesulfovibrio longus]